MREKEKEETPPMGSWITAIAIVAGLWFISDTPAAFFRGLLVVVISLGVVVLMQQKGVKETVIVGGILGLIVAIMAIFVVGWDGR
jgi:predicted PurR-regulated permease PerM